ncbi:hypothetical protein KJ605_00880 [Patescibacteria group bacterium]|nr:hypothetical protein [Patescibacteria group bacterium]MBU1970321.1 hypothetical protein [Patescibacteria group bacterium]
MKKLFGGKTKRQKGILYVDRSTLSYYVKGNQKPFVLELAPDVVKDMEIVNPEKFLSALAYWMDNNKLSACDLIIVVSEHVYFEHAVQSLANSDEDEKEIELFLGTVPFEQPISRVISDGTSKRVVVLGRDYYDLLLEFLEKRYFRVLALFPASLLGIKSPAETKTEELIRNLEDYKKFNFLSDFERKFVSQSFFAKNAPSNTKNLKIMIGFLVTLLIVLGGVIYFSLIRTS